MTIYMSLPKAEKLLQLEIRGKGKKETIQKRKDRWIKEICNHTKLGEQN